MGDLAEFLMRNKLDPEPEQERGFLWPIMRQGNKLSPAVPGIIHEPYQALARLLQGSYVPGSRDGAPIQDVTNVAGAVMMPSLGLNMMGMMPKNALGIFGGRLAKTADHNALAKAEQMAAGGADRQAIWDATGWFQGRDGKWRFEIPDNQSAWNPRQMSELSPPIAKLQEHLTHDAFFDAYPAARNTDVLKTSQGEGSWIGKWGTDDPHGAIMEINPQTKDPRSVALHEAQHGVAYDEGFLPGASPHHFAQGKRDALEQIEAIRQNIHFFGRKMEEAQRAGDDVMQNYYKVQKAEQMALREQLRARADINPFDMYRRTAGEVEARNVQSRMGMTADERRAKPPWLTEDIPWDQQIIK